MKLADRNRPWSGHNEDSRYRKAQLSTESDIVGVREIIRLLVAHGADISFMLQRNLRNPDAGGGSNAFTFALETDSEAMADELLVLSESLKLEDKPKREGLEEPGNVWYFHEPWNHFLEKHVLLRSHSSPNFLKEIVKPGESNLPIFHALLHSENERGIAEFKN